jgi:hypothetical protein
MSLVAPIQSIWLSWNREALVRSSMGPLLGPTWWPANFSPTRAYYCGKSSRGAGPWLGSEGRVMTSVCCYFDRGLFHFLLWWWFSSPGGILPLIHRLSCVGVVSFCVLPLYPTMFYRADASPFLYLFCILFMYCWGGAWRLRRSVSWGAARQRSIVRHLWPKLTERKMKLCKHC